MIEENSKHYTDMKVEPWEAMEAWLTPEEFKGYLRGSAIKYLARAGHKDSYLKDIEKAGHFTDRLLESLHEVQK